MTWTEPLALMQAAPELTAAAERIAWSQLVMAVGTSIVALAVIAAAIGAFLLFRAVRRLLNTLERQAERLAPRTEPLLEHAGRVVEDARRVSDRIRLDVERLHETVDELNRQLRAALDGTEERVRQFGAVLQVVQDEVEELLLDAAATARGLHATAEGLQDSPAGGRRRRGPALEE